jgi:ankyrin repeat protein
MSRSKKATKDIHASFPTCGEVFHFIVTALDLHQWRDMWKPEKRPDDSLKPVRLWKSEELDVPTRDDFSSTLRNWLADCPAFDEALKDVLVKMWGNLLDGHCRFIKQDATFLSKEETRRWNVSRYVFPTMMGLYVLQKVMLRKVTESADLAGANQVNPILGRSIHDLLKEMRANKEKAKFPLTRLCVAAYPFDKREGVDAATGADWRSGAHQPLFSALSAVHTNDKQRLEVVFNFAFARLLERIREGCSSAITREEFDVFCDLVIRETELLNLVEEDRLRLEPDSKDLTVNEYYEFLKEGVQAHTEVTQDILKCPNMEQIKGTCYEASLERIRKFSLPPPAGLFEYVKYLLALCNRSGEMMGGKASTLEQRETLISEISAAGNEVERVVYKECLKGHVRIAEAHMAVIKAPDKLDAVFELYDQAVNESLYSAGAYTKRVVREAFAFVAFMYRNPIGAEAKKTLLAWLDRRLKQWDLLDLGNDFDHEQRDQRFERAARLFSSQLSSEIQEKLRMAFSGFKPKYFACGDMNSILSDKAVARNQETGELEIEPLNPRRKDLLHDNDSLIGRTQTVLMEALDRGDIKLAEERVRNGEDLNFVNSTGDTALTKALTRKQYPLVMAMLQRETDPVTQKTVLRNSEKFGYSLIRKSIDHGQMEILREVFRRYPSVKWSERIIVAKCDGMPDEWMTPLYYGVNLLGRQRLPVDKRTQLVMASIPPQMREKLQKHNPKFKLTDFLTAYLSNEDWTPHNPDGVLGCVKFLVNEARVDLDTPHFHGHSALTLSVEDGLHDVTLMLLEAGANVNHRIDTGATALAFSICKNDVQMARLLLEYKADCSFVFNMIDQRGYPRWRGHIYEMPMSEEMRRIIGK